MMMNMIPSATRIKTTIHNYNNGYRFLTSQAARSLLGLPSTKSTRSTSGHNIKTKNGEAISSTPSLTLKELRHAYFAAAKKCHPDLQNDDEDKDNNNSNAFLQVTLAYEMLQKEIVSAREDEDMLLDIPVSEDEEFRKACRTQLGIDAEIVEECKKSPIFRQWLLGRTDSAHYWRSFFTQHGGFAPKLRPVVVGGLFLTAGDKHHEPPPPPHTTRRKKK
jgi:DnaJ domain